MFSKKINRDNRNECIYCGRSDTPEHTIRLFKNHGTNINTWDPGTDHVWVALQVAVGTQHHTGGNVQKRSIWAPQSKAPTVADDEGLQEVQKYANIKQYKQRENGQKPEKHAHMQKHVP